jgi:outer membrane protein with beta-barrel domain
VRRFVLALIAVAVASLPREAAAQQSFVNLFVGKTSPSTTIDSGSSDTGFGVAFGSLGHMVSAETEFAYFPEVFDTTLNRVSTSYLVSVSGNILVGPTIGPAKIYGAVGFGDLYLNVKSAAGDASIGNNYLTLNGGAGLALFFASRVGVRGDLRYYRATGIIAADLERVGLDGDRLAFWRPTVGLTLKF